MRNLEVEILKILGQEKAQAFFAQSLQAGRLAHAYLLVGPDGIGKRTLALHLAQALLCPQAQASAPCGECSACRRIAGGGHPDVMEIAPRSSAPEEDARHQTIGIDQIRELERLAHLMPYEGRAKVFILNGADLLSADAAHAFLKTLEEPPPQVYFFLLASRRAGPGLPATIRSRCQRLDLTPVPQKALEDFLAQEHKLAPERARALARLSRGCPGWAMATLTNAATLQEYEGRLQELWGVLKADLAGRFQAAARRAEGRSSLPLAMEAWQSWWRDMLLAKAGLPDLAINTLWAGELQAQAARYSLEEIAAALAQLQECRQALERNASPRLALENLFLSWPERDGANKAGAGAIPAKAGPGL